MIMKFYVLLQKVVCWHSNKIVRCSSSYSFDPYKILDIPRNASKETIKSAYFKLAKKYHPDKNPSDAAAKLKFENIQNAYRHLMEQIAKSSDDPEDKNTPYDFTVFPLGVETHPVPTIRDSISYRRSWYILLFFLFLPIFLPHIHDFMRDNFPERKPNLEDEIAIIRRDLRFHKIVQKQQREVGTNLNETLSSFK